jgi:hypothetical protein
MRRIAAWIAVLCGCWSVGFLVNRAAADTDLAWTFLLDEGKRSIANATEGRRILLAGGSQTHYSVSALLLGAALSCQTVNYGLHGGLGLNPIVRRVAEVWRPGDLVVVLPEYGILAGSGMGWLAPAFGAAVGIPDIGGVLLEQKVHSTIRSGTTSVHSLAKSVAVVLLAAKGRASASFGPRGDTEVFFGDRSPIPTQGLAPGLSPEAARTLAHLMEEANRGDVDLVFALPWVLADPDSLDDLRRQARETVKSLERFAPVVTYGESYNLQVDPLLFSDTELHASEHGRRLHSLALAAEIARLGKNPCSR